MCIFLFPWEDSSESVYFKPKCLDFKTLYATPKRQGKDTPVKNALKGSSGHVDTGADEWTVVTNWQACKSQSPGVSQTGKARLIFTFHSSLIGSRRCSRSPLCIKKILNWASEFVWHMVIGFSPSPVRLWEKWRILTYRKNSLNMERGRTFLTGSEKFVT